MPFVGIDAKHDVDLDCFNASDVLALFPGVCTLGSPGRAHASVREMSTCRLRRKGRKIREESRMCDCLDISGDQIMILISEVNVARFEAFENVLDDPDTFIWGTMLDDDLADE